MRRLAAVLLLLGITGCGGVAAAMPSPSPTAVMASAASAHVTGTLPFGASTATVDVRATQSSGWGTVTVGAMRVDGVLSGGTFYVRGRGTVARFEPVETVDCVGDRWVVPPPAAGLAGVGRLFDLHDLAALDGGGLHLNDVGAPVTLPSTARAVDLSTGTSVCSPQTAGPGWSG
jgi:hypothetical protein